MSTNSDSPHYTIVGSDPSEEALWNALHRLVAINNGLFENISRKKRKPSANQTKLYLSQLAMNVWPASVV
jgi:hypothetical protein